MPTPSSWGANGWQSAVLFKTVIDQIVATDGPNAITRAKMLEVLGSMGPFDANGWMARCRCGASRTAAW